MISRQVKFIKIKNSLSHVFKIAAEYLFLSSLILLFISLLLGAAVFYKYYILVQKIEPALEISLIKFEEGAYREIIKEWQNGGERFEAAKTKKYPDLFRP